MVSKCLNFPRYNNKTYRIDDIDWSVKPTHAFQKRDGSETTYVDYYKQVRVLPLVSFLLSLETAFSVLVTFLVVGTSPTSSLRGTWSLLVYSSRGSLYHGEKKLARHTVQSDLKCGWPSASVTPPSFSFTF